MKAYRSGVVVKLGALKVPVNIYSALDSSKTAETRLNVVCNRDHEPVLVRNPYVCDTCDHTGPSTDFVRGKDTENGVVVVDTATVETAIDPMLKEEIVLTAHELVDVLHNTVPSGKTYTLGPANAKKIKGSTQDELDEGYALLQTLISEHPDHALIGTFAFTSRAAMFRLCMNGNVISMTQLAWPEELKETPEVPEPLTDEADKSLVSTLLQKHVQAFDPADYKDVSAEARANAIEAAMNGTTPTASVTPVSNTPTVSLRDRLREELAA